MRPFFLLSALICLIITGSCTQAAPVTADTHDFSSWLRSFKQEAKKSGISDLTLIKLDKLRFNPRIIVLDQKQPESRKSFEEYYSGMITKDKLRRAREFYHKERPLLTTIEQKYHVQPQFIIALWGIETDFGRNTGNFSTLESLATLAYEGRRRELFKTELLQALIMIDKHQASSAMMRGSWAGAMGQTQFMPSSFRKFAVSYHHEGQADIWHKRPDVFASIANYLSTTGWDEHSNWGREVMLPAHFDHAQAKITLEKPVSEWQHVGIRTVKGSPLPVTPTSAALIIPGDGDKAFLVYANYKTLLDWNRSTYFATTVGLFADAIAR